MKTTISLILILFIARSFAMLSINQTYEGSCLGLPVTYVATVTSNCTATACSCSGLTCFQITCSSSSTPTQPSNLPAGLIAYSDLLCNTPSSWSYYPTSCAQTSASSSLVASCSGSQMTVNTYSSLVCTGSTSSSQTYSSGCSTNIASFASYQTTCSLYANSWTVTSGYSSCGGNQLSIYASNGALCNSSASACACSNAGCLQVGCQNSQPSIPSGLVGYVLYSDTNCQYAVAIAGYAGACVNTSASSSVSFSCSGKNTNYATYSNAGCQGSSSQSFTLSSGCQASPFGLGSIIPTCSLSSCFHQDTKITYKNQEMSLQEVVDGKHPQCAVPHVQQRVSGLKISTTCSNSTLRLTKDHLVFTEKGLIEAQKVKIGDLLFSDLQESKICVVEKIEEEMSQKYFGLNCEDSVVLADGYKTSTFGINHQIPSIWMKFASKIFGVKLASSIGDYLGELVQSWKLI